MLASYCHFALKQNGKVIVKGAQKSHTQKKWFRRFYHFPRTCSLIGDISNWYPDSSHVPVGCARCAAMLYLVNMVNGRFYVRDVTGHIKVDNNIEKNKVFRKKTQHWLFLVIFGRFGHNSVRVDGVPFLNYRRTQLKEDMKVIRR